MVNATLYTKTETRLILGISNWPKLNRLIEKACITPQRSGGKILFSEEDIEKIQTAKKEQVEYPSGEASITELAWLAGIIDGEGCVRLDLRSTGGLPRCSIGNTSLILIDKVRAIYTKLGLFWSERRTKTITGKPFITISIQRKSHLVALFQVISPYSTSKKRIIEIVGGYCSFCCDNLGYRDGRKLIAAKEAMAELERLGYQQPQINNGR